MDAGSSSKSRPDALSQLLHRDEAHSAHSQLDPHQHFAPRQTFRQPGSSTSSGTDADFGRFAHTASGSSSSSIAGGAMGSLSGAGSAFSERSPEQPAHRDGADIQALLSSNTLTESVSGDWQAELASHQSQPWRLSTERSLPRDPLAGSSHSHSHASAKGKGKGREQQQGYSTSGDVSPITSELIHSLSTLNVSDQTYLRTLLAQSPDQAISDYFSRGTYSDDVWGTPAPHPAVDAIMQKASAGEDGAQASAHEKAVRRLAMVARHLAAGGAQATQAARQDAADLATDSVHRQREGGEAQLSRGSSWVDQYPILAMHAPYAEYVAREAPVHPAQHQTRYPQKPGLTRHLAHARPLPPAAAKAKEEDRIEEEPQSAPALGPFSRYFEEKLRQMASLQSPWRRTVF